MTGRRRAARWRLSAVLLSLTLLLGPAGGPEAMEASGPTGITEATPVPDARQAPDAAPPPSPLLDEEPGRQEAAERHFRIALEFLEVGREDAAVGHLRYCLALEPDHLGALRQLGLLYYGRGQALSDRLTAESFFGRAMELAPDDPVAPIYRGTVRTALGRFAAAEADARRGLEIDPGNEAFQMLLGNALLRQRRFDEAVDAYRRAATDHPDSLWARWNLALSAGRAAGSPSSLPSELRIAYPADDETASPVLLGDEAVDRGVHRLSRGRGVAWSDLDGDGLEDAFAVGIADPHALFRNRGDGTFEDVSGGSGLQDPRGGWSALAADFDDDGDADLYVTRDGWAGRSPNSLYRNDGSGSFVDVAASAGVAGTDDSFTAATADFDGDGHLDIYVANGVSRSRGSPNALYRNRGDGTFEEVASRARVAGTGSSVGAAWGDIDGDGDPDLYVTNYGGDNALYRNRGDGTFENATLEAGAVGPRYSFIPLLFDYDNDTDLDIFVASWTREFPEAIRGSVEGTVVNEERRWALLENDGRGTFRDVTESAGLANNSGAMSATTLDLDNDGYLDLLVGNGGPTMDRYEPDRAFLNRGDGTFAEISGSSGLGSVGKTHGLAAADFDRDGDLDLYAGVGGQEFGDRQPDALFVNPGAGNHWLTVRLVGTRSNRDAVGARVSVTTAETTRYREVAVGVGFGSTPSLPLEFGLGSHTKADRIEIAWPAGGTTVLGDVPADRAIVVTEGGEGYSIEY